MNRNIITKGKTLNCLVTSTPEPECERAKVKLAKCANPKSEYYILPNGPNLDTNTEYEYRTEQKAALAFYVDAF